MDKANLFKLLAENDFDRLFQKLSDLLKDENSNLFIHVRRSYKDLKDKESIGVLSQEDYKIGINHVTASTFSLINQIPEDIFEKTWQQEFAYDVFFSYSDLDSSKAKKIWTSLRASGLNVFLVEEFGLFKEIDAALKKSKDFVLLCTPNAMRSRYVQVECQVFLQELCISKKAGRNFIVLQGEDFDLELLRPLIELEFVSDVDELTKTIINMAENKSTSFGQLSYHDFFRQVFKKPIEGYFLENFQNYEITINAILWSLYHREMLPISRLDFNLNQLELQKRNRLFNLLEDDLKNFSFKEAFIEQKLQDILAFSPSDEKNIKIQIFNNHRLENVILDKKNESGIVNFWKNYDIVPYQSKHLVRTFKSGFIDLIFGDTSINYIYLIPIVGTRKSKENIKGVLIINSDLSISTQELIEVREYLIQIFEG